jgi:light-regulated signal transduction histidine kinase (bacteriophytochrome)
MSVPDSKLRSAEESMIVPWADVVRFVRQLNHDLRNHLNAVELQSAFVAELAADSEMKEEIKRLRQMISRCGSALQQLSTRLSPASPTLMPYRAVDLIEDLRAKLAVQFAKEAATINWDIDTSEATLEVDPQLLQQAFLEIFTNAFQHELSTVPLHVVAGTEGDMFIFTLTESKTKFDLPTENWGREPLRNVQRGYYGLGLNRARAIVEAQGGKLGARYDTKESKLVTRVSLPLSRGTK